MADSAKEIIYTRTYPLIRFHREHGKTVSLTLAIVCLMLFALYSKTSYDFNSVYEVEAEKRLATEEQLQETLKRVELLENEVLKSKEDSQKIVTEAEVAVEVAQYPAVDESQSDTGEEDIVSVTEETRIAAEELDVKFPASKVCPDGKLNPEMFENAEEFKNSPFFSIPTTKLKSYAGHFWGTEVYEETYLKNPPKKTVPRLKYPISQKVFLECFMNPGFPVIFKMENLQVLGYKNRGYTLDEFIEMHPTTKKSLRSTRYRANGLQKGTPDLGPGLLALKSDSKKKKMGVYRNYPRNMKLSKKAVNELGLEFPPYHNPRQRWQLSTMFMGSTSADTPLHGDCCDNFVHHFVGTKRWIISPPTESRFIHPKCAGGLCWGKAPLPMHPSLPESSFTAEEIQVMKDAQFLSVDITAGEMLYLPSGWFHAVYNLDPTVTLINWVSSGPSQLYVHETGKTGGLSEGASLPCLPGMSQCGKSG